MNTYMLKTPDGIIHTIEAESAIDALAELALQYIEKDILIDETNTKLLLIK